MNKENIEVKKSKKKHKLLRWILIGIFSVAIIFIMAILINKQTIKNNSQKFIQTLDKVKEEEVSYVFVEINPKFVFTIKNNKVQSVGCLNDDCMEIYNQLNVLGKDLNESIEYIYNYVKENGYDKSGGVKIKTYNNVVIGNQEYIEVKVIDKEEQDKLLNQIINNDEIKEKTELEDYNMQLWNEIQKDEDYGEVYECILNNKELECYITHDFQRKLSKDLTLANVYSYIEDQQKLMNVLDKFNIKYEASGIEGLDFTDVNVKGIYINDTFYKVGAGACYNNNCYNEYAIALYDQNNTLGLVMNILPITKINLVNLEYNEEDVMTLNNDDGITVTIDREAQ